MSNLSTIYWRRTWSPLISENF